MDEEQRKAIPLDVRLQNALDGLCDECKCSIGALLQLWKGDTDGGSGDSERLARQAEEARKQIELENQKIDGDIE